MQAAQGQQPPSVRVFTQRFSATRRGARLARRLATYHLAAWRVPDGTPLSETVTLIVAELSANAVLHGRVPGRDFEVRLSYDGRSGTVRVEVSDTHPASPVLVRPLSEGERGRGLLLVDTLADRWGVSARLGPGKKVWAEVSEPR